MSRLRPRLVAFALAPVALTALLVFGGVELGRHLATRHAARAIEAHAWNGTLGDVVDAADALAAASGSGGDAREDFAKVYLDPERAVREMGSYVFSPPMTPTPFVGHAPSPGRYENATINAQQLRHDTDLEVPKPEGLRRVFVTGGSTAFGAGAPGGSETITGFLQALVDARVTPESGVRYEIVNAAAPAWASTQERIFIEQRLSELEPDLVVSLSGVNDAHWGALGRDTLWFRSYTDQHYLDLLNLQRSALGLGAFTDVAPRRSGRLPAARVAANVAKNVTLAAAALAPRGVDYVYVLQPSLATTGKPLTPRERKRKGFSMLGPGVNAYFVSSFDALRERLGRLAIPRFHFVDLTDVFDDSGPDTEIFLDSYHFGDRGNERIARALYRELAPLLRP